MTYTDEQYALLEKIEPGILWPSLSGEELSVRHYLELEGLLQPREDLQENLLTLSEHGKRVLADHRARREKLREEAEQHSSEKREKKHNRVFEAFLVILGVLLGMLADHIGEITSAISALFS